MTRKIQGIFFITCLLSANFSFAQLKTGEQSPNPELVIRKAWADGSETQRLYDYKDNSVLLVAIVPSVTKSSGYANVLTGSFDTYFAEGMAFPTESPWAMGSREDLRVLIITSDKADMLLQAITTESFDFDVMSDENMELCDYFGVKKFTDGNSPAAVFVIDKNNSIAYADYQYTGQGEKLKEVQAALFTLFDIQDNVAENNSLPLMVNDKARDFGFRYVDMNIKASLNYDFETAKLSDYLGKKNVLIAFYPAAYSYGCAMEVTTFDRQLVNDLMLEKIHDGELKDQADLEILMVSMSNLGILSKWKDDLNLKNVKLVNDAGGEISAMYNSLNNFYNRRTLFLVNKEGNVSYINWDYQVNDEEFSTLKEQISSLTPSPSPKER